MSSSRPDNQIWGDNLGPLEGSLVAVAYGVLAALFIHAACHRPGRAAFDRATPPEARHQRCCPCCAPSTATWAALLSFLLCAWHTCSQSALEASATADYASYAPWMGLQAVGNALATAAPLVAVLLVLSVAAPLFKLDSAQAPGSVSAHAVNAALQHLLIAGGGSFL